MKAIRTLVVATVVAALAPALAHAAPADTQYSLIVPPSSLQIGCFGPCDCAVVETPTYGSFNLIPNGSDPLYSYYLVERYIASYNNGPGAVSIIGTGTYRIGGEVALMQQMTLDLEIEGRPPQHFDSGLVPLNEPFPQIHLSCPAHGFACHDTVVVIDAKPVETAGVAGPVTRPGIEAVWPNPFHGQTSITLAVNHSGPVDVSVIDLAGKQVRALGRTMVADRTTLTWDGRDDKGRAMPAGIYWVLMRWQDGRDQRRVIKLD